MHIELAHLVLPCRMPLVHLDLSGVKRSVPNKMVCRNYCVWSYILMTLAGFQNMSAASNSQQTRLHARQTDRVSQAALDEGTSRGRRTQNVSVNESLIRGSNPRNAHGIRLRPTSDLRKYFVYDLCNRNPQSSQRICTGVSSNLAFLTPSSPNVLIR